jgi:hypothetical protein
VDAKTNSEGEVSDMTQWEQIALREGVRFSPISLPKVRFVETLEPLRALALLIFHQRNIWIQPSSDKLIRVSYTPPHFEITVWREGAAHLEITLTPNFNKVTDLLSKYPAFLGVED